MGLRVFESGYRYPDQYYITYTSGDPINCKNGEYIKFSGYFGGYGPHVFAAAPKLLEALEELLRDLVHEADPYGSQSRARAAIAKAKGETK